MDGKIYVGSIETLERLEVILGEFAERTSETLEMFGRETGRRLEVIDEHCEQCEREYDRCAFEYESADSEEDDVSYLANRRDEAQENLRQSKRWQKRIEETNDNFVRSARRVDAISKERLAEARGFLQGKIRELHEYTDFRVESVLMDAPASGGIVGTITNAISEVMSNSLEAVENVAENMTSIVLPTGFKWVRLDEIDEQELADLPTEREFRKGVSPDEMKTGFEILKRDILPVFKETPERATADYFEKFDRENHRDVANSSKKIFNVFFGRQIQEYIRLERFVGQQYGITNGKHRIKIARELGWTSIPAEAIEVELKKEG